MSTAEWEALPESVKTFMTALDSQEFDRALATFASDAVVTDDGRDHAGTDEIRAWLATAVTEYTYTAEFAGASTTTGGVDVGQHLEGDFPGGVVDLNYRFTLDGAVIRRLVIEP
ncbi:nuclear transport factor 2 family protein [Pseudonocardia alni]|uniref:nuclear transport factor 2 family protein n=2 Tax=Pseudonocardia alni TaxID=33907 RepID=UPI00280AC743|nr:nuclear transport factor 2 family protein [Pseudonocardia alni]